jgi:hypothetical protein
MNGEKAGEGEQWREVNSSMIYWIHYKNLHKCYNVPQPSTTIKGKKLVIIKCTIRGIMTYC